MVDDYIFICNLDPKFRRASNCAVWRGARVVEEARLESVYTPKVYHGFESRSLRIKIMRINIYIN